MSVSVDNSKFTPLPTLPRCSDQDLIVKALVKAQKEFTRVTKDKTAAVGKYSYKYADLATVIESVRTALAANEIVIEQSEENDDRGVAGIATYLWHTSGQFIRSWTRLIHIGDTPQLHGSAITYARRYGLSLALAIAPDEDDDAAAAEEAAKRHTVRPELTKQALQNENPGDYVVKFGKYTGRRVRDFDPDELMSYCQYITASAADQNKQITGIVDSFMKAAQSYLSGNGFITSEGTAK